MEKLLSYHSNHELLIKLLYYDIQVISSFNCRISRKMSWCFEQSQMLICRSFSHMTSLSSKGSFLTSSLGSNCSRRTTVLWNNRSEPIYQEWSCRLCIYLLVDIGILKNRCFTLLCLQQIKCDIRITEVHYNNNICNYSNSTCNINVCKMCSTKQHHIYLNIFIIAASSVVHW